MQKAKCGSKGANELNVVQLLVGCLLTLDAAVLKFHGRRELWTLVSEMVLLDQEPHVRQPDPAGHGEPAELELETSQQVTAISPCWT